MMGKERLEEVVGRVLLPMITPFREDGEIDYDLASDLARMLVERKLCDSIIVCGTTGEFYALSMEERKRLMAVIKEAVGNEIPLIAGTGAIYTRDAIELTKEAESLGYNAVMVVSPYYCKPEQDGMFEHFKAVAESTSLPVILYNIPLFTGVNISPDLVARLSEIENIKAIKEEAAMNPTQTSEFFLAKRSDDFVIYSGDDTMILQVLCQGGVGVVSGGSHIVGDMVKEMIDSFLKGDVEKAIELNLKLYPFFKALSGKGRINPIPMIKEAVSMTWRNVGSPRPPLLPATQEEREMLLKVLRSIGKI
jgi:4-hydroxy-tetrahydrodipicolinate synthase